MHVFAHEAVAHYRIGKSCIAVGRELARTDHGRALSLGCGLCQPDGLATPGQVARLEGAADKIEQADLAFVYYFPR